MNVKTADYVAWSEYVTRELTRWDADDRYSGNGHLWRDTPGARAFVAQYTARGFTSDEAAFCGPWHIARKHVTSEFRQWVEEEEATERLTLSDWEAKEREARKVARYEGSGEFYLDELSRLVKLQELRDSYICEAARLRVPKTHIARAVGLSRQQVHAIIATHDENAEGASTWADEWEARFEAPEIAASPDVARIEPVPVAAWGEVF